MTNVKNKYENSQRAIFLRNWCGQKYGRGAALAAIIFDHTPSKANSLSHYKNGRFEVKDWLWEKIQNAVKQVEKAESKVETSGDTTSRKVSKNSPSIREAACDVIKQSTDDKVESNGDIQFIQDWLKTNRKTKLRLGNAIYAHNFSKPSDGEINYYCNYFSTQLNLSCVEGKKMYLDIDTILKIIKKVDYLINTNHPFAVAAARSTV